MKLEADYRGKKFVIEEDSPEVGVYLYIYENGKCICDYLQNDIDICIEIANEDYEVPINIWSEVY